MARTDEQLQRARDYILAHPGMKNADVAKAAYVSLRTVTAARASLVDAGKVQPAFGDRKHKVVRATETVARAAEGTFDPQTTADLNREVEKELAKEEDELGPDGEVDVSKLKQVLWRVIRRNADDRIVVAAAGTLSRIQQETSARPLGPGKPMTREGAIERLILMFKAVGVTLVVEALNRWMGKGTTNAGNVSANTGQAEQGNAGTAPTQGSIAVVQDDGSAGRTHAVE